MLWTPTETILTSTDQFDELAAPYEELGFDEFVLHHPAQTGPYGGSLPVFEQIAQRATSGERPLRVSGDRRRVPPALRCGRRVRPVR